MELKEAIKAYQNEKMHWMDFAPLVIQALEKGDTEWTVLTDSHPRTSKKRIQEIMMAYRFLAMRRPEAIKPPHPNIFIGTVRYLPTVYSRMAGEDKEERFERLIDDVLSGKCKYGGIQELAKSMSPYSHEEDWKPSTVENSIETEGVEDEELKQGFVNSVRSTMTMLKLAVNKLGYETLRIYAKECDDLATQLNCVADGEYLRMWNERKEFTIPRS